MLKVVGHSEDFEHENLSGLCYTSQALTLYKPNCGNNDGFGREPMILAIFKPEDIASQVKRAELTAAVLQEFVAPGRGQIFNLFFPKVAVVNVDPDVCRLKLREYGIDRIEALQHIP